MSTIRNINVSFTNQDDDTHQSLISTPARLYSIHIQATADLAVIGKYRDQKLYAVELKRTPSKKGKE